MSPANRAANVAEELTRSDEALAAAKALMPIGLLRDAASRLYYAIFHATLALLLSEELEPKSHQGVLSLLGLHFIKPHKLPAEMSAVFRRIQAYREAADYTRGFVIELAELERELVVAERFVAEVRGYLRKGGYAA